MDISKVKWLNYAHPARVQQCPSNKRMISEAENEVSNSSHTKNRIFRSELMRSFGIVCLLIASYGCIQTRSNRPVRTEIILTIYQ